MHCISLSEKQKEDEETHIQAHSMCSRVDRVSAVEYVPGFTIATYQTTIDQSQNVIKVAG